MYVQFLYVIFFTFTWESQCGIILYGYVYWFFFVDINVWNIEKFAYNNCNKYIFHNIINIAVYREKRTLKLVNSKYKRFLNIRRRCIILKYKISMQ